jgi:hypothetical protein
LTLPAKIEALEILRTTPFAKNSPIVLKKYVTSVRSSSPFRQLACLPSTCLPYLIYRIFQNFSREYNRQLSRDFTASGMPFFGPAWAESFLPPAPILKLQSQRIPLVLNPQPQFPTPNPQPAIM